MDEQEAARRKQNDLQPFVPHVKKLISKLKMENKVSPASYQQAAGSVYKLQHLLQLITPTPGSQT
jgi:hypothetical protein